ncbi:Acetylornithine deacetylase [Buchnera aphidicola (Eriosoma grossulariae)]|uniref:acetylornithine deacetylase n=1 Tax=Buchnera aphidicola TaxID=9 RepID=UPI003464A9B3
MQKFPKFIQIYETLIKTISINSTNLEYDYSNKKIIDILANWLNDLNFSTKIQSIPLTNNKFNLLAKIGYGPGGLLLSGHSDTVDINEKLWTVNPFQLTIKNDKFYGLGTVDMKGFISCVLDVLFNFNLNKIKKPLYILITADEETTMSGAKYFSKNTKIQPDLIIIGEPTSLKPIIGHKGHISKSICVTGTAGHSSDPDRGINSIEIMYKILTKLFEIKKKIKNICLQEEFKIPYSTMNLGCINGGKAANIICDLCTLSIDIRLLPNLSIRKFDKIMLKKFTEITNIFKNIKIKNIHDPIPSYTLSKFPKMINLIEKLSKQKSSFVNYCTEASYMQNIAPTLILGPGSINQAHQPNEYLDNNMITPAKKIIKKFIEYFCIK